MGAVRERAIGWLAGKAGDYLRWVHEREIAWARENCPECPDCKQPDPFCWCAGRDRERAEYESIFGAGYEAAQDDLRRGGGW